VPLYPVLGIHCTAGIEPADAARITRSALPRRRVVLTSRCSDYLLVLVYQLLQQRRQPIRFLDSRVKFPILLGDIVGLPLGCPNAHRTNEFHFGTRRATLSGGGRGRKFALGVVTDLHNVPFGKGIS